MYLAWSTFGSQETSNGPAGWWMPSGVGVADHSEMKGRREGTELRKVQKDS